MLFDPLVELDERHERRHITVDRLEEALLPREDLHDLLARLFPELIAVRICGGMNASLLTGLRRHEVHEDELVPAPPDCEASSHSGAIPNNTEAQVGDDLLLLALAMLPLVGVYIVAGHRFIEPLAASAYAQDRWATKGSGFAILASNLEIAVNLHSVGDGLVFVVAVQVSGLVRDNAFDDFLAELRLISDWILAVDGRQKLVGIRLISLRTGIDDHAVQAGVELSLVKTVDSANILVVTIRLMLTGDNLSGIGSGEFLLIIYC